MRERAVASKNSIEYIVLSTELRKRKYKKPIYPVGQASRLSNCLGNKENKKNKFKIN
jgi:hypothetical protein